MSAPSPEYLAPIPSIDRPRTMTVRLGDGREIENVPVNTTREQLLSLLISNTPREERSALMRSIYGAPEPAPAEPAEEPELEHRQTILGALSLPFERIPQVYLEESRGGQEEIAKGNIFTGGFRYLTAPLTAITKPLIGENIARPLESAGVSKPISRALGTLGEIFTPGLGITKLPGYAARAARLAMRSPAMIRSAQAALAASEARSLENIASRYAVPLTASMESATPLRGLAAKAEATLAETSGAFQRSLEAGQAATKKAASTLAAESEAALAKQPWRGIEQASAAAEKGDAQAARLMRDIEEAGSDWREILKTDVGMKNFRSRQVASRLYDRVGQLAGKRPVAMNDTLATLERRLAEEVDSVLPNRTVIRQLTAVRDKLAKASYNFTQARAARSDLQKIMDAYRGQNILIGPKGIEAFADVKRALGRDLDKFASEGGGALKSAWQRADKFYAARAEVFKNKKLAAAVKNLEPDAVYKAFIQGAGEGHGALIYRAVGIKGRAAIKAGAAQNALQVAVDANGVFSPAKYSSYLQKIVGEGKAGQRVFSAKDLAQLEDFSRMMRGVEAYGQFKAAPPTGARLLQALPWLAAGTGNFGGVAAMMAGNRFLAWLFTAERGKALLRIMGRARPGSPQYIQAMNAMRVSVKGGKVAKGEQEVAEQFGSPDQFASAE